MAGQSLGTFVYGDTQKGLEYEVRSRSTGSLVDLTAATNAKFYAREVGKQNLAVDGSTATTGGALGTLTVYPGALAGLSPGDRKHLRFEVWYEFDLSAKHWNVPDDGFDYITVRDIR